MQCRKLITVENNKKRMNITNFINIYTNIYSYVICDKNDSTNFINVYTNINTYIICDKNDLK